MNSDQMMDFKNTQQASDMRDSEIDLKDIDIELGICSDGLQRYVSVLETALAKHAEIFGIDVPLAEIAEYRNAKNLSLTGATKDIRLKHTRKHFARIASSST